MKIIRKTKSVCPVCIENLDADIIEEDNIAYMLKNCSKHGKFKILLSEDSQFYKEVTKFYMILAQLKPYKKHRLFYQLYLTYGCNLNCPICYTNANNVEYSNPSIEFIRKSIKNWKNVEIALFGGEPTTRDDLAHIIKCIENTGNIPVLVTNGIKISNLDYLKSIKSRRLFVLLQFDGFSNDVIRKLRGAELLEIRKRALNNLKKLNIPASLEVAVAKNVNEDQLGEILEFASNKGFIKIICYRASGFMGRKELHKQYTPTVNSLIEAIEKQTSGMISKRDVSNFQNLIYFLKMNFHFLPVYPCSSALQYLLFRDGNHFKPISEVINLDIIQNDIERYFYFIEKGKRSMAYFITSKIILKIIIKSKFLTISKLLFSIIEKKLINSRVTLREFPGKFLILRFSILCEPNTFDLSVAKNCAGGEIRSGTGVRESRAVANMFHEKRVVEKEAVQNQ